MSDEEKSKAQLVQELAELRQRVAEMEKEKAAHQQAEEALRAREESYRSVIENVHDIVYSARPDGTVFFASPNVRTFTGFELEEVIGHNLLEFVHPDDRERVLGDYEKTLTTGAEFPTVFRLTKKDGSYFYVEEFGKTIREGNEVAGVTGIVRDITERQQLKEQLNQSQKMQAVGQLTSGIAHNFNNMLMGIMGNLEVALLHASESQKPRLEAADRYAQRGAEMVKQLMVFSHRGTSLDEQQPLEINSVIHDMVAICRKTFDRKIDLDVNLPAPSPVVLGDTSQLGQVFLNLCLNAQDALKGIEGRVPRIKITAGAAHYHAEDIPHPGLLPGEYVQVRVSDNGVGMDEDTRERVFEPFFTTKEIGKGTGLGLATAFTIVRQHGGWIRVESQSGAGTTFSVYLPGTGQAGVPEVIEESEAVSGGTETILVIDDDQENRNVLSFVLERHGYTVLLGADGKEGLDIFQHERDRIALVLLDLVLPKMSGQNVLTRILALDPDAKVVVSTGISVDEAELAGAKAILTKPYRSKQVLQTLRRVLDQG